MWVTFCPYLLVKLIVKPLHPFRRFLPHGLGHVAIHIQGELCGCMAQVCLDGFDVIACVEGGDGEGVSEVVEAGFLHTGTLGDLFEVLDHGAPNQVLADGIGEHQIHGVAPAGSGEGFGSLLLLLLLLQSLHDNGSREDGAASAAFGRLKEIFSVLALELLLDGDDPSLKVYIIPTQSQQLALSHARKEGDDEEVAVVVQLGFPEDRLDLLGLQGPDLRLRHPGELAGVAGIDGDGSVQQSLLEGAVEHAVDILDGLRSQAGGGESVVEPLDGVGCQLVQPDGAESGLEVLSDLLGIVLDRQGLTADEILLDPGIEKISHSQLAGHLVGTGIDSGYSSTELLGNLALGFAGDGLLTLLSGHRVQVEAVPGLPERAGCAILTGDGALADAAGTCGSGAFCHVIDLLSTPGWMTTRASRF